MSVGEVNRRGVDLNGIARRVEFGGTVALDPSDASVGTYQPEGGQDGLAGGAEVVRLFDVALEIAGVDHLVPTKSPALLVGTTKDLFECRIGVFDSGFGVAIGRSEGCDREEPALKREVFVVLGIDLDSVEFGSDTRTEPAWECWRADPLKG